MNHKTVKIVAQRIKKTLLSLLKNKAEVVPVMVPVRKLSSLKGLTELTDFLIKSYKVTILKILS